MYARHQHKSYFINVKLYKPAKETSVSSIRLPSEPLRLLLLLADPLRSEGSDKIDDLRLPRLFADPLRSVSEANEVLLLQRLLADPLLSESEAKEVRLLPQLLLDPLRRSRARAPNIMWSDAEA